MRLSLREERRHGANSTATANGGWRPSIRPGDGSGGWMPWSAPAIPDGEGCRIGRARYRLWDSPGWIYNESCGPSIAAVGANAAIQDAHCTKYLRYPTDVPPTTAREARTTTIELVPR
jgi:hypothetical protein